MHTLKFVDSITASPVTLLDIYKTFGMGADSTFTPPTSRRILSSSAMADGSFEPDVTYGDREIVLELEPVEEFAPDQLEALQRLARLIAEPQWLMVQQPGTDHPVFFRTRRGDLTITDVFLDDHPMRRVNVVLPADPFGYGLPESGNVAITNHPLAGTNRMCVVFDPAKGDVPTPLHLTFTTPARTNPALGSTAARYRSVVASWSPKHLSPEAMPVVSAPTGVGTAGGGSSVAILDDADYSTGTKFVVTPTSINGGRTLPFSFTVPAASDYRVFLRARVLGGPVAVQILQDGVQTENMRLQRATNSTRGPEWFDLGVVRLPIAAVDSWDPFGLSPDAPPTQLSLRMQFLETLDQSISIDTIMMVPVSEDATLASQSTSRMPSPDFSATTPNVLTLDGVNDRRYVSWTTNTDGRRRHQHVTDNEGGLPKLSSTVSTQLTLLPVVALEPEVWNALMIGDPLGQVTDVSWLYFPRYLYMRGAE